MSSSISSSERAVWRHFAGTLLAARGGVLASILAVAYAVDPYDTGRSTLFEKAGVRPQGPRTAAASRGRDPAYNAAVIGTTRPTIWASATVVIWQAIENDVAAALERLH